MKRWKIILSFLAVFLAGGIVGSALSLRFMHHLFFSPPLAAEMTQKLMQNMRSDLQLTPEQAAQIEPIVARATESATALHRDVLSRVKKLFEDSDNEIGALLTPEQQALFEKVKARRPNLPEHP
jgi:Spy/CpxP family protein refolding chaperone